MIFLTMRKINNCMKLDYFNHFRPPCHFWPLLASIGCFLLLLAAFAAFHCFWLLFMALLATFLDHFEPLFFCRLWPPLDIFDHACPLLATFGFWLILAVFGCLDGRFGDHMLCRCCIVPNNCIVSSFCILFENCVLFSNDLVWVVKSLMMTASVLDTFTWHILYCDSFLFRVHCFRGFVWTLEFYLYDSQPLHKNKIPWADRAKNQK